MNRTLFRAGTIVTMDAQRRILHDGGIMVHGSTIEAVLSSREVDSLPRFDGTTFDLGPRVAIPGFIQTHVHLCQTLFRGLAEDLELLDWLRLRIFPLEAAHSPDSMFASAMVGIAELIRSGTTTILDMGSIHHEESVVRAIEESGLRAFVGKAMMDLNEHHPSLCEGTRESVESTRAQARLWHGTAGGRIRYAVAPRFVLSCTEDLLREAMAISEEFPGVLFHTHASENRQELDVVRARCGTENIDYFGSIGLLRPQTCLAHCVWPTDREMDLMAERQVKVLHCPSSNMKLASGIAPVPAMLQRGITVSLGADGAPCNNRLDMFQEMHLAALLQKPLHGPGAMPADDVFELATRGGAAALGILGETGSLEAGKRADIVFLDTGRAWNGADPVNSDRVYATIVHTASAENVRDVMIDGRWVYRDGMHTTLDADHVARRAQEELRQVLRRTDGFF